MRNFNKSVSRITLSFGLRVQRPTTDLNRLIGPKNDSEEGFTHGLGKGRTFQSSGEAQKKYEADEDDEYQDVANKASWVVSTLDYGTGTVWLSNNRG